MPTSPLPSRKSPKNMQIQLQTIRPTLVISRVTLVITRHTLIPALVCSRRLSHPGNPPKSCKSCFRQSPQISHKLSSSLVKHSHERPCASGAPPIPKIPPNPANPAPDNPPNVNHSPSPISHDLVQAVLLSTIHYPLSTGVHYPLVSTKNLPTARSGAFVL